MASIAVVSFGELIRMFLGISSYRDFLSCGRPVHYYVPLKMLHSAKRHSLVLRL
jgi:hypothetical protein